MTALHYTGYLHERSGIMAVVRALAAADQFDCVLGVNPGFKGQHRLSAEVFHPVEAERIGLVTWWRAGRVAREVEGWLAKEPHRVFHGHSRAGLLVALRLWRRGERRVVASVHCYGRQRWFYRWAGRTLGSRLFWLSPAMKQYYGVSPDSDWSHCIPGCIAFGPTGVVTRRRPPDPILRIGGVGMLVAWKRWDLVLAALGQLTPDLRARVRFVHIGSPTDHPESRRYAGELREMTSTLGLSHIVEWRGEQPSSANLLSEIDVLVVASQREPLSVAMLEALGSRVPVLASFSGGNRDVIAEPRTGWFFRAGDGVHLSEKIAALCRPEAWQGIEILPGDVERFEAGRVASEWLGVYRGLEQAE